MLRENLDRRLPEEQWNALQAHLETCPDCRGHQADLHRLEKETRRSLQARWEGVQGPQEGQLRQISGYRKVRNLARRRVIRALLGLAGVLLFLGAGGWELARSLLMSLDEDVSPPPARVVVPGLAALPDAGAEERAVQVLYAASPAGSSDLFLLAPGSPPVNLTGTSGLAQVDETSPAWSPDGNWIAYLSNLTGKNEVYVSALQGEGPVQVTHAPDIEWLGPLSWSPDGRWIALTGLRLDQGRQSWIYVIPLDGEDGPRSLAGTRGGWAPEFSPAGNRLAFLIGDGLRTSVAVFYFQGIESVTSRLISLHWTASPGMGAAIVPGVYHFDPNWPDGSAGLLVTEASSQVFQEGSGLDWSPNGDGLVYLRSSTREGGGGAQVNVDRELDHRDDLSEYALVSRIAESTDPRLYQGVTWSSSGAVVYLEQAQPGSDKGCKEVRVGWASSTRSEDYPLFPPGLCVTGGLDRSSWSSDGRWLVVTGTLAGESQPGLLAIRFAGLTDPDGDRQVEVVQLSGPGDSIGEASPARVRPRLKQEALAIEPRGVVLPAKPPMPPSDPSGVDGQIVFSLRNNAVTVIVRSAPDGNGGLVLTSSSGNNRCPRFSPDGTQVAFVSDEAGLFAARPQGIKSLPGPDDHRLGRGGGAPAEIVSGQEVFVMTAEGKSPRQVSNAGLVLGESQGATSIKYDCPVWSPDGLYLAAGVSTSRGNYVAILPVPGRQDYWARVHYFRLDAPPKGIAWRAGSKILIVGSDGRPGENMNRFLEIRIPDQPLEVVGSRSFSSPDELGPIHGMALSPDGSDVFVLTSRPDGPDSLVAELRQLSLENWLDRSRLAIGLLNGAKESGSERLAWLGDGAVGIIFQGGREERYKTYIYRLNVRLGKIETLASFEDQVYSAAWSEDGSWVIFSAESGLWLLDAVKARREGASPAWISPVPVYDLDWGS